MDQGEGGKGVISSLDLKGGSETKKKKIKKGARWTGTTMGLGRVASFFSG